MSNYFSDRLKALRGTRSKAEFARFIGVPAPMYHRYELGQVPKSHYLQVIAARCGVTVEYLLGDNPGLAIRASAYPPATKPASSDMMLRDAPATPPQPLCRYPADCDLVQELSKQRQAQADVQAQLATLSTQVETLTRLLGATLAASTQNASAEKSRAG
jgi:transcriptional regulator with XRE-family HTH domain